MVCLVLIPALFCDARLYGGLCERLPGSVHASVMVPSGATLEACAADILRRAPERFVIAGTSFGGHVALETALAAPGRVAGLWIMGASANAAADPGAGAQRSRLIRAGRQAEIANAFARDICYLDSPAGAHARDMFLTMALAADAATVAGHNDALAARADRWPLLARVACPALLVWGRHDTFSVPADGRRMAGALPLSTWHEIAACGHLASLEQPGEVARLASKWLAGLA